MEPDFFELHEMTTDNPLLIDFFVKNNTLGKPFVAVDNDYLQMPNAESVVLTKDEIRSYGFKIVE
jgi:hypothetical protein